MKLKIPLKSVVFVIIFLAIVGGVFLIVSMLPKPIDRWKYSGVSGNTTLLFRTDLRKADKVDAPDCNDLRELFRNTKRRNVTFYFMNEPKDYGIHRVEIVELVFKMITVDRIDDPERTYHKDRIYHNATPWNTSTIPLADKTELSFLLIGPHSAEDTRVKLVNATIVIEGTSIENFDRATIKTMMCMFGIELEN